MGITGSTNKALSLKDLHQKLSKPGLAYKYY